MAEIRNVKLELLRQGPAHNQLLSPLTPYLALCGADGPVTVQMPFEHRQLVMRLRRLRYEPSIDPQTDVQRQAEIRDIGEAIGRVLGQVPALLSELGMASTDGGQLVHLRLSLSGFELGLMPFEAAVAPDGFPGSGSPLFLQSRTPISLTREIRRGRPLPIQWNRAPRILFAFATPAGLAAVPAQDHLAAIRDALDPWIKIADQPKSRLDAVKDRLTVLPDASLERIRAACAAAEYTHVHLLAHGGPIEGSNDERFGVVLCSDTDPGKSDVVDGERLAIALTGRNAAGTARFTPTVVTLATCDSGNVSSVLTPGGSIAHELHGAGIPWVIASQFPLWMRASSIAAEVLYGGLLRGTDPRWVVYQLRQRLRTDAPGTHDWASIVAYATVPWDFESQVAAFREKQIRAGLDVKFDRIDELVAAINAADSRVATAKRAANKNTETAAEKDPRTAELRTLCASIRADLKAWRDSGGTSDQAAERLGMSAASEKRIAIAYGLIGQNTDSNDGYKKSRDFYRLAIYAAPFNHWVLTQYLSILATPPLASSARAVRALPDRYGVWWAAAKLIAQWQLQRAQGNDRAWALGTLAELALLGAIYGGPRYDAQRTQEEIGRLCQELRDTLGLDPFPLFSTRRQFLRYIEFWDRAMWKPLAEAALEALGDA